MEFEFNIKFFATFKAVGLTLFNDWVDRHAIIKTLKREFKTRSFKLSGKKDYFFVKI